MKTSSKFRVSGFARRSRGRGPALWLGCGLLLASLSSLRVQGAGNYGRLAGSVTDAHGTPLIGVTVLIMSAGVPTALDTSVHRVITDAQGKFAVERLLPGRYSLQVSSPTHLPVLRSGVKVEANETARLSLVLGDIFAPFQFQTPTQSEVTVAGDDWKWVLRTSASTRPILRYRSNGPKSKQPFEASQALVGVVPGPARGSALTGDAGLGSVLAYVRPLSDDADVLVAGSMAAEGTGESSLVTAFRRNIVEGNPQELALIVHRLNLSQGLMLPAGEQALTNAQGVVVSYNQTRRLSEALTVTSGFEMDYLNALRDAFAARPHAELAYRLSASDLLTFRYGSAPVNNDNTLIERVGELSVFPRVTQSSYHPRLEKANHTEVSFTRQLTRTSKVEVAAYHDGFQDAVVRGFGRPDIWGWVGSNSLPNTVANGLNLNAGDYGSSGVRATVCQRLGKHLEADVLYSTGDSLAVRPSASQAASAARNLKDLLKTEHGSTVAGKLYAQLPVTKTTVITSYEWLPRDRVTGIDPYGQAGLELQPYLGVQIRQPLPTPGFLPAHVEALADFQNLLAQGYVRLVGSGDQAMILTPAYRSFRGGFSVQF